MQPFSTILDLACGRDLPDEKRGSASRWQLSISAVFFALLLSSLWGAAVGSKVISIALANTYNLPLILLVAMAAALPVALLARRPRRSSRSMPVKDPDQRAVRP